MNNPDLFNDSNLATYCPEDDKLRLYVGRVPREEYEALRREGWTSTPKQDCDFVAVWTPRREDTAISYAGIVLDEDQSPQDRAADRAERFGGYCDKRIAEAEGHADRYDEGPSVHGYQSQARAERAAARHDRIGSHAVNAWRKAEYWQRRTAGVIAHALYKCAPGVRMGRIKTLEAELRKAEKNLAHYRERFSFWASVRDEQDAEKATRMAIQRTEHSPDGNGNYRHPRPYSCSAYAAENATSLFSLTHDSKDPITGHEAAALWLEGKYDPATPEFGGSGLARQIEHLRLRLSYENQMLDEQGGRLETSGEIAVGGRIGSKLVWKVNKSPATDRVVSVSLIGPRIEGWVYRARNIAGTDFAEYQIKTERLPADAYTEPTPESLGEVAAIKAQMKEAKAGKPAAPALINPTDEDAEKLQAIWNEGNKGFHDPKEVACMTQAEFSANSKGGYAPCKTRPIAEGGKQLSVHRPMNGERAVCKVREFRGRVVILSDKPRKPLPKEAFTDPMPARRAALSGRMEELRQAVIAGNARDLTSEESEIVRAAKLAGFVSSPSWRRIFWTDEGAEALRRHEAAKPLQADLFA